MMLPGGNIHVNQKVDHKTVLVFADIVGEYMILWVHISS